MKHWCRMPSPIGDLILVEQAGALLAIDFTVGERTSAPPADAVENAAPLVGAVRQLEDYFNGRRRIFDIQLSPQGTAFQQRVWQALRQIPFGVTASYSEIAHTIGQPTATRAVGLANGRNPIPIVIPCHRVIGKSGALTGYAGGLPIKQQLLGLEGIIPHGGTAMADPARQPDLLDAAG